MQVTVSKTVPLSPITVWEIVQDHEGMTSWAPGLKATLDRPGAHERNGVGAVRRIAAPGPAPAIVEEITAFEPGRRLGYRALSGVPFKGYRGEILLGPSGAGTEIRWTLSADQRVPLAEKAAIAVVARTLLTLLVRQVRAAA